MTIEEIENEEFENFAKQFENVPKEKVIKLLYEALQEDTKYAETVEEASNFLECMLEGKEYIRRDDLVYLKGLLDESNTWVKEN